MNASPSKARFDYDEFSNCLSNERDRQGITVTEAAALVGIDPHIFEALERGSVRPNLDEFVRLLHWMPSFKPTLFFYFDEGE